MTLATLGILIGPNFIVFSFMVLPYEMGERYPHLSRQWGVLAGSLGFAFSSLHAIKRNSALFVSQIFPMGDFM